MLALQAAWPMFMPRISIEDVTQESGVFFGDRTGTSQYQIIREAVIKVKPPLIPLFSRTYPIANNMRLLGSSSSLNLQIDDGGDGRSIKIKLGPVTGWSFDEVAGKIRYQADRRFNFIASQIDIATLVNNRTLIADLDNRDNELPVRIYNLTFQLEKDTPAWSDIKKWVDDGSCVQVLFSDQRDYRNSTVSGNMRVNEVSSIISRDTMKSPISMKISHVLVVYPRENKELYVVFEETDCKYFKY